MHASTSCFTAHMARLTKKIVESSQPPDVTKPSDTRKWSWLGDSEVPGFGVKIYGRGTKVFCLRYRTRTGRQRMLKLGRFGELTVQQARDLARKEKVRVLEGEDPQAERHQDAVGIATVGELMGRWIDDYAKAHRRRWEEDEGRVERNIRPTLGRVRLEDLTRTTLASWHRKLGEATPIEANRCLETLRAAWRWAVGEELLSDVLSDPTTSVKKFKERSRDRWLKKEEVKRLMEAVDKEADPYVRAAIPLFLLTGLRKRELLTSRWSNVDLARREIRLPETKTGEPQIRDLPDLAVQLLRELPRMAESPFVFPSPTDPSKPRDDIKKPWARIRRAAHLEDVTLHDLRRTAGSHMAQAGVPLQVIGEVLGHSHPGVTKLYARLASENKREALDTLSQALSSAMGLPMAADEGHVLPDKLRALLDVAEHDPDALAAGVRSLAGRIKP